MRVSTAHPSAFETQGYGQAQLNPQPLDVVGLHLHRFLAPALLAAGAPWATVDLCLGFEGGSIPGAWLRISGADGPSLIEAGAWPERFASLTQTWRDQGISPRQPVALRRGTATLYVAALCGDLPSQSASDAPDPSSPIIGFLTATPPPDAPADPHPATLSALASLARCAEDALRAARHNLIRLLFDEGPPNRRTKDFLYDTLALTPDLCGADHSAALILTNHLEAMTLRAATSSEFEVVAERMFFPLDPATRTPERLVGLVIAGQGEHSGLLGAAFSQTQRQPLPQPHLFLCDDDDRWYSFAEPSQTLPRFSTHAQRPQERMCVLTPLLHQDEHGQHELFGFLAINYRSPQPLSALDLHLISTLAKRLARHLKHSPMFTLSARQMLLIERVRAAYGDSIGQGGAVKRMEAFIQRINADMIAATALPCFAIGYTCALGNRKALRFIHPQGFTHFQSINLSLEPGDAITESSIAALSLRINRPLTLVAGSSRNALYVNESTRTLRDGRVIDISSLPDAPRWRRLADYYKPSRDHSYATLAFPITLGGEALGVVAIEVDRDTDWFWWTGFGSQSFYRLLAAELAVAFKLMGVTHM
jgi:hypothetical protein